MKEKCTCGCEYQKDGFDIDAIHMYPLVRWNEIYVSKGATQLVEDALEEYFGDCGEVREIRIYAEKKYQLSTELLATRYGLVSNELSTKYQDKVIVLKPEEYAEFTKNISGITIVENENEELCMGILQTRSFQHSRLKIIIIMR